MKALEILLSLPLSLYVSFRLFPFKQAIHIPLLCRFNTKLVSLSGSVNYSTYKGGGGKFGILRIGFGHVGIFDKRYERSILEIDGEIEIKGRIIFGHGSRICVMKPGKLILGKEFINTAAMTIVCNKEILFGNHVLTSWNTLVMDTDFHATYDTEKKHILPSERNVHIGSNVWIGTRSVILKGTDIADGCIVGACSLVSGQFNTPNTIIAGNPAQEKKHSRTLHREITSD